LKHLENIRFVLLRKVIIACFQAGYCPNPWPSNSQDRRHKKGEEKKGENVKKRKKGERKL
jgi:hypothetical protein